MDKLQKEMKNMKNDMKEGAQKVGHVMKHTAEDLKDDVMGAMASMEMRKDEMMEKYEEKKFSRELKKQMEKESENNMKH